MSELEQINQQIMVLEYEELYKKYPIFCQLVLIHTDPSTINRSLLEKEIDILVNFLWEYTSDVLSDDQINNFKEYYNDLNSKYDNIIDRVDKGMLNHRMQRQFIISTRNFIIDNWYPLLSKQIKFGTDPMKTHWIFFLFIIYDMELNNLLKVFINLPLHEDIEYIKKYYDLLISLK